MVTVLQRPTLVLNRNWQPVSITTVARALVKVWNETARIVDPQDYQLYDWDDWAKLIPHDNEPFISTAHSRLRAPEVVVLTVYDRVPKRTIPFSRRNVFKRDRSTCQYCGRRPSADDLTIDHVIPRAAGRVVDLGELRSGLRGLQLQESQSDSGTGKACPSARSRIARAWNAVSPSDGAPVTSWAKFISEAYWTVELEE